VLEAGTQNLIVAFADEILHDAVTRMVRHDIGRLPVVRRDNPRQILGYLGRASVMTARLRRHEEESHREAGWLQALTHRWTLCITRMTLIRSASSAFSGSSHVNSHENAGAISSICLRALGLNSPIVARKLGCVMAEPRYVQRSACL
jgi:CBS domain-containing protein